MITMKGAAVSAKLKEQVEKGLETLTWVPKLTIIRVGENPDDISYEKGATKKLTSFGLEVESKVFPGDISDEAFKKEFAAINADASVDGILMLRPLPKQINEQDIEKMIDPAKDLDGISPVNIAKVFSGDTSGFAPCTAEAVVCMLKMNDIALSGKRVAVVGRSMVVGRPLSMLLLHENATVTICHSRTASLPEVCREADILIGTQMIIKGHDFPRVTLVGILAADLSLYSDDFRAGERTFQLLTQAAGRAGRAGAEGLVVIQTYNPENYAIETASHQDYEVFYEKEMAYRRLLSYPPAGQML